MWPGHLARQRVDLRMDHQVKGVMGGADTIELFFRWLKGGLGCRHRLSPSANGVRIQVYVAIMARPLIRLWVGRSPTKRTYARLCFDLSGWANAAEVIAPLDRWHFRAPPPGKT